MLDMGKLVANSPLASSDQEDSFAFLSLIYLYEAVFSMLNVIYL